MTKRQRDCIDAAFTGKPIVLTIEEVNKGWHFCPDWDSAFVTPEDFEWGPNKSRCYCGQTITLPQPPARDE